MSKATQKMQSASPSKQEEYDLVILGSGATGKLISWTLAKKGMKTAVVERKSVGGACPNIACLPSKNVVHSAEATAVGHFFWEGQIYVHKLLNTTSSL